jgi:glycosyl transferase family 25
MIVYYSCIISKSSLPNYQSIDQDVKIYVVSLKKDVHRRQKLLPILKQYPLHYTVVTAFPGWKLNTQKLCANQILNNTYNPRIMSRGHVGCFLSHLAIYRSIVRQKLPWGLILEDDVVPRIDFMKNYYFLKNHIPAQFDVIWLGYHSQEYVWENTRKKEFDSNLDFSKGALGTYAYIISYDCAVKILQSCFPINKPIDVFLMENARSRPYHNFLVKNQWVDDTFSDTQSNTKSV